MPLTMLVSSFVTVFLLGYLVGSESDEVRSHRAVMALLLMSFVLLVGMVIATRLP